MLAISNIKIVLLILTLFSCKGESKLPAYNASLSNIIVSGISSGGFMALQFSVAYSGIVSGAANIAGGPYACAEGSYERLQTACTVNPSQINLQQLDQKIKTIQSKIDSMENIKKQKYYFYSGKLDSVVYPGVIYKAADQFKSWGANILTKFDITSEHAWITNNFGNLCYQKASPYINNCNYNMALDFMQFFQGKLKTPVPQISENVIKFSQEPYLTIGDSLNKIGYLYVPTACKKQEKCSIVICYHGCNSTPEDIGTDLVIHSGLNEIAESNNMIVLYPQAQRTAINPSGCQDLAGYTNSDPIKQPLQYVTKDAKQMKAVYNMLKDLTGNQSEELIENQ